MKTEYEFPSPHRVPSISPDEIAALMGVTPKTVRTQLSNGKLPVHYVRIGKQYRANRAEVYELIGIDCEEA